MTQITQDTLLFQEMVWEIKPDLVTEIGVAQGGSINFSASLLALLESSELVTSPSMVDADIVIRETNRRQNETHPMYKWVQLVEGSSIDPLVISTVRTLARDKKRVMVFLDSNHEHNHVLGELRSYADLVTVGSILVVLDTGIELIDPTVIAANRPWGRGNSPLSALREFLHENPDFIVDNSYHDKARITSFPMGVIRGVR